MIMWLPLESNAGQDKLWFQTSWTKIELRWKTESQVISRQTSFSFSFEIEIMQLLLSLKYDNFDVSAISVFQPTNTSQSKSPGNEVAADFALTDMYTVLSWVYKPTVKKLNIRRFSIPKLMTPSFEQPQPKLH